MRSIDRKWMIRNCILRLYGLLMHVCDGEGVVLNTHALRPARYISRGSKWLPASSFWAILFVDS